MNLYTLIHDSCASDLSRRKSRSAMLCHDLDDPLAGLAAKFCLMGASNDPLDRAIYAKLTFEEFARIAEWIRPDAESTKRTPR